jgi:hypothetical protein
LRKIEAHGEGASRRIRQRGRGSPVGSSRSAFQNVRSAMAIVGRSNDVSRGRLPTACLGELTSDSCGTRMRGYTQP